MYITEKRDNLQQAYKLRENEKLDVFEYDGGNFKIIGLSENNDLLPKSMNPFCKCVQYVVLEETTQNFFEIYVYYYKRVGENVTMAIVDAIRPQVL